MNLSRCNVQFLNSQVSLSVDFAILKFCSYNKKPVSFFLWKSFHVNKKWWMKKFQVIMWYQNLSVKWSQIVELQKKMLHLFSPSRLIFHIHVPTFIQKDQTWRVLILLSWKLIFWLVLLFRVPHFATKGSSVVSQ